MENNEDTKVFTTKILKTIEKNKNKPTSTIARIVGKHCKRESLNNVAKRREIRRKITLHLLKKRRHSNKNENRTKNMFDTRQLQRSQICIYQKNSTNAQYHINLPPTILSTPKPNRTNLETNEKKNKTSFFRIQRIFTRFNNKNLQRINIQHKSL